MASLKIIGFAAAAKEISRQAKNVKFAGTKALTQTAVIVRKDVQEEMKRSFDRPTRYTLNSIFIKPASKSDPQSHVGFKSGGSTANRAALKYLQPVLGESPRKLKGVESVLRRKGLLPSGMFVVPGKGVRLNKSGNITKNRLIKILNSIGPGKKHFVGKIRGTLGVWERTRGGVKPILIFIQRPKYKKLFDFHQTAEKSFNNHFDRIYDKSLKQALGAK